MSTVAAHLGAIQRKLDFPSYPGDGIAGEALLDVIDEKITQANMSRVPWFLTKSPITTNIGQFEYALETDADKLRYVYAVDSVSSRRYPYEIVPYESLTEWHHAGDSSVIAPQITAYSSFASRPERACAAYYDVELGQTILEITPRPAASFQLIVVTEPSLQRPGTRSSIAFRFDQFRGYVTDCAALRLLTVARWEGMEKAEYVLRRRELAGSLTQGYGLVADVARGDRLYFLWRHSGKNPSGLRALGWAKDRL